MRALNDRFRPGMAGQLLMAFALLILPLVIYTAWSYRQSLEERRDHALDDAVRLSETAAAVVHGLLRDLDGTSLAMSQALGAQPGPLTQETVGPYLGAVNQRYPFVRAIFLTDPSGQVIAAARGEGVGTDLRSRPYTQALLGGQEVVLSDAVVGIQSGTPTVTLARTVRAADGRLRGLLAIAFYPAEFDKLLPGSLPGDTELRVFDRSGRLIYSSAGLAPSWEERDQSAPPLVRDALTGRMATSEGSVSPLDGQERLRATLPVREYSWVVSVSRSVEAVERPLQRLFYRQMIALGLVSAALFAVALIFSRALSEPLARLAEQARALGRGDVAKPAPVSGPTEVQAVGEALTSMAAQVQARFAEREAAQRRVAFLAEASAVLAASLEFDKTLAQLARLAVPELADWCTVDIVERDGSIHRMAAAHRDPARDALVRDVLRHYPPDPNGPGPIVKVLRTGRPEIAGEVPDTLRSAIARDPEHLALLRELASTSFLIVPLAARGRILGALGFHRIEPGRPYGPDDVTLAEDLARRAATAVDNARLFEAEREARAQAEAATQTIRRLQGVSEAALAHLELDDLLAELLERIREMLGVETTAILLLDPAGDDLVPRASRGLEEEVERGVRIPIGRGFAGRIAAERRPVVIDDLDHADVINPILREKGICSMLGVPLLIEGRVTGVLHVGSLRPRRFTDEDTRLLQLVADRVALAIEHARLYEAEHAARAEAEAAQRRLAFLAEASAVLAASLDFEQTLARVARLAVPAIADWCAIDMVEDGERLRRIAAAHADPAKEAIARELRHRYPPDPNRPHPAMDVVRAGRPSLLPETPDELLVAVARDAEHLRILRELNPRSHIVVPIAARGRTLGAITLITSEPDRRYGPEDLALAEDLARRAAAAMETALLYREAQEALREAETALAVREEFLSIASHELRTPLTALKGQLHLMRRRLARGVAPHEVAELSVRADAQVDRLNELVHDLLDVSQITSGRFAVERERVALGPIIQRVVEMERAAPPPVRIELALPEQDPVVEADRRRLEQVLVNLIENARKYAPAGRPVRVRVAAREDTATIAVQDEGIGIPPEDQAHIFDRFHRAGNVDKGISGFGLGLYISREIVRAHGGDLIVESAPGAGSTFTVILPWRGETVPREAHPSAAQRSGV